MDCQKSLRYFTGVSMAGAIWLLIIGGITTTISLFCIAKGGAAIVFLIIGLICIGCGVLVCILQTKKKVSDAQYDENVRRCFPNIDSRALYVLGIDKSEVQEIEPIRIEGYVTANATRAKRGADNYWRTDRYSISKIFFGMNELHCYRYNFSTLTGSSAETTEVYFYKDIVSVTTSEVKEKVGNKEILINKFVLTTVGGTSFVAGTQDIQYAQRSINAMRALLREKKV